MSIHPSAPQPSRPLRRAAAVWLSLLLALPWIMGCEGCRTGDPAKPDEDLPVNQFSSRPIDPYPSGQSVADYRIKPGHWFTATKPLQANREDERGTLEVSAGTLSRDESGRTRSLPQPIVAQRPVVLPKGQLKRLDFRLLAPLPERIDARDGFLRDRLTTRRQGLAYDSGEKKVAMLRPEQYFFVVLTTRPERFVPLQVADWVKPPRDSSEFESTALPTNYRMVFPEPEDLISLPETMLDWTSTAYLLWDDVAIDQLTPAQQQAVLDWLHWGGRIIVNGRYADKTLAGSLLAEWLPMTADKLVELDGEQFAGMLEKWAVDNDPTTVAQVAAVRQSTSRVGIEGQISAQTEELPDTQGLVLARRVGLGNIVMTRFDLTTDVLKNWGSRNSFFNNLLLRRPHRAYATIQGETSLRFAADPTGSTISPAINTPFRLFARDGVMRAEPGANATGAASSPGASLAGESLAAWSTPAVIAEPLAGVGGWTDRSHVAATSIDALAKESGISIPPASFVARSLAWYLVILVPLNYLVFRVLRRLEYAWIAVPLIAIGGAIWVARAARLDIGFARLQNEISFLEMQPGYDRAHQSSFIALYSSLGTNYELQFDTLDAVALPVGVWDRGLQDAPVQLRFGYGEGPVLAGVEVASNRTRLMHAEQILSVGGPIQWDGESELIRNQSELQLSDVVVIRKSDDDQSVQVAAVGDLAAGSSKPARFTSQRSVIISNSLPLPVRKLMQGLAVGDRLRAGEARLVARVVEPPSKMQIEPTANQISHNAVLLAHLQHPQLPPPQKDVNLAPTPKERIEDVLLEEDLND